ncbi:MAG: peptidylprolyl isomerase, partial [Marinirhabdus sp.]
MKSTTKNKLTLALLLGAAICTSAQEVVTVDSTGIAKQPTTTPTTNSAPAQRDTVAPFKRFKAEGVTAVVGQYVVLDTDIDKAYLELQQQGRNTEGITRCNLLGKLMEDKLYIHHAKQDSIAVSDGEINAETEQVLQVMVNELGSEEKVVELYKKSSYAELRSEVFQARKNLKLAALMQQKVVEGVEVTPEEVRTFFYGIPKKERPVFGAEVEVSQIIIEPEITEASKEAILDRLNEMRADIVENGASFTSKAVFYSDDTGSAQKGGLIEGITRNSQYAKEFKDQAFSLQEGEVSEPFETQFGHHILKVEKIRGQQVDVRHILLFPEVSQTTLDQARKKMDSVRTEIENGNITFAEAAKKYSTDEETRGNGGQLVNPQTLDTRFDLTKLDPT